MKIRIAIRDDGWRTTEFGSDERPVAEFTHFTKECQNAFDGIVNLGFPACMYEVPENKTDYSQNRNNPIISQTNDYFDGWFESFETPVNRVIIIKDFIHFCKFHLKKPATKNQVLSQFPKSRVLSAAIDSTGTLLVNI